MSARAAAPLIAALLLLVPCSLAHAKAPRVPTAEELVQRAVDQDAAEAKRRADELRASPAGRIAAFTSGELALAEWAKVAELVLATKPDAAAHRIPAAEALIARLDAERKKDDPAAQAAAALVRTEAARALAPLMTESDDVSQALAVRVLGKWFPAELQRSGFRPGTKLPDRRRAQQAFLKSLRGRD